MSFEGQSRGDGWCMSQPLPPDAIQIASMQQDDIQRQSDAYDYQCWCKGPLPLPQNAGSGYRLEF